jgi:ABC-type nitrate/sulfonate/bicarbonate transport system substrate-binding protein
MKKFLSSLHIVTLTFCLHLILSSNVNAQTLTPIRAAYVPVATWLPAWIAKDKEIFKKNGLDVSLTPIQNVSLLPPTLGKQFDFAASTPPDLIKANASGIDIVGVTGGVIESSANQTMQLIVKKGSGIKTPADLKGKIIATPTTGGIMHVATLFWLKKNGVDINTIQPVEVPFANMPDQLKASRIDAMELLQPFVGQVMAQPDYETLGNPMLKVDDPTLFVFWISNGAWARANQATVKKWTQSISEANEFIEKNPAEAKQILAKYTNLPPAVTEKLPLPAYNSKINASQVESWVKVLKELGLLNGAVDSNKMVINN